MFQKKKNNFAFGYVYHEKQVLGYCAKVRSNNNNNKNTIKITIMNFI